MTDVVLEARRLLSAKKRKVRTQDRSAMHDIKWIRDNAAVFDAALKRRGLEP
jgi:hypothetical protein